MYIYMYIYIYICNYLNSICIELHFYVYIYIYHSIPGQTKRTGYTFINSQWPAKLDEATSTKEVRSHFELGFSEKQHNSQATSAVKFTTWSNISKSGTNWGYHDKSQRERERERKEREREKEQKKDSERVWERERERERDRENCCHPDKQLLTMGLLQRHPNSRIACLSYNSPGLPRPRWNRRRPLIARSLASNACPWMTCQERLRHHCI